MVPKHSSNDIKVRWPTVACGLGHENYLFNYKFLNYSFNVNKIKIILYIIQFIIHQT